MNLNWRILVQRSWNILKIKKSRQKLLDFSIEFRRLIFKGHQRWILDQKRALFQTQNYYKSQLATIRKRYLTTSKRKV